MSNSQLHRYTAHANCNMSTIRPRSQLQRFRRLDQMAAERARSSRALLLPVASNCRGAVRRHPDLDPVRADSSNRGVGLRCALMIRDLVRRRRQGWRAMLLLGIALAIAEECLIQQTSLAPLVGCRSRAYLWALAGCELGLFALGTRLREHLGRRASNSVDRADLSRPA